MSMANTNNNSLTTYVKNGVATNDSNSSSVVAQAHSEPKSLQEEGEERALNCGLGPIRPECCQPLRNVKLLLVALSFAIFTQVSILQALLINCFYYNNNYSKKIIILTIPVIAIKITIKNNNKNNNCNMVNILITTN